MTSIIFRIIYVFFNLPILGLAIFMSIWIYFPVMIIEYMLFGTFDKKTSKTFYKIFCFIDGIFIEKRKCSNVKKNI